MTPQPEDSRPDIVFILADDLGYGDIGAFNADSRIPTPHLDRLAGEGVRLTDVHAAALCCPSRYQFLTGEYRFRNGRQGLESYLTPGQPTVASLLREAGYRTAMLGKWHVGFAELGLHPDPPDGMTTIPGGPVDYGFDSYAGIPASLDIAPYFFIEDDRIAEYPSERVDEHHSPAVRYPQGEFWRAGGSAPGYRHAAILPDLADRAERFIAERAGTAEPFFLYFALPAPHAPWLPAEEFRGRSGAGDYGDFVVHVDDVVGRVLAALDAAGRADRTLLVFTSDNGPTWYPEDVERYGHRSAGSFRGMKADAWDGGNRIPFIARWPGVIPPATESAELVSFTDMLATFTKIGGAAVPPGAAVDSIDVSAALTSPHGADSHPRQSVVLEGDRELAIRSGDWKLIPWAQERSTFEIVFPSDGSMVAEPDFGSPDADQPAGRLYHLASDPGERINRYAERPDVVAELTRLLDSVTAVAR